MEYFKHFPHMEYSDNECVNITTRLKIKDYLKSNVYIYEEVSLRDYERPDILANKYYGNYKYTWLIFYANDIFDPIRDWFKSYHEFNSYINFKYKETSWKAITLYQEGNKILYGNLVYRCTESHVSDSRIDGFYLSSNSFKKELGVWPNNYMINQYAFFYNILNRENGIWLKILNNNGVMVSVDGLLPPACNCVEMFTPTKWELFNNGTQRPGFEVAHQTIHEFRDSHDLVVDFQTWYDDVLADITNEGSYYGYDFANPSGPQRQIVRMIDFNENFYFIEMKRRFNYNTGLYEAYYSQEDITTYLDSTTKRNYLIQDFTVRTKNINDPPEWVKNTCKLTDSGWIDNTTGEIVVPVTYLGKRTITKYQHEVDINEDRRTIKLIDKRYVPQILQEFKQLLGSRF